MIQKNYIIMKTVHLIMGYKMDYPKIINLAPELEKFCKEIKNELCSHNDRMKEELESD